MKILVENSTGLIKSVGYNYIVFDNSIAVIENNNLEDVILNLNSNNSSVYEVDYDFIDYEVDTLKYIDGLVQEA